MKLIIATALAAILVVSCAQAAVLQDARAIRANLAQGNVSVGDRLLYRVRIARQPILNSIQSEDIIYRGNSTTRIRGIFATEQGYTQYASARVISGGLNQSFATVRLQSLASYGYDYLVEFWGR